MELVQFDIEQVIVAFDLVDLPTLAKLCTVAWENLFDRQETEALARQARTYAAAFQAMAVGGLGMAYMPPDAQKDLLAELAKLGLGDLVDLPHSEARDDAGPARHV
jgi:hypothetical protein